MSTHEATREDYKPAPLKNRTHEKGLDDKVYRWVKEGQGWDR